MIDKSTDVIYNGKYILVVPNHSELLIQGFKYSFENVICMNNSIEDVESVYKFIERNNFLDVIFVDYILEYSELITKFCGKYNIKFVFTKSLSSLCDEVNYFQFSKIFELYDQKVIDSIGFLDSSLYNSFKSKIDNVFHIILDIEKKEITNNSFDKNKVGILSDLSDAKHSSFNQISAVAMLDKIPVVSKIDYYSKSFFKTFDIKYDVVNYYNDLFKDNGINLYVNFTNNNSLVFIKSLDCGIPCVVGNNTFLDSKLNDYLMVKSDDDINEIKGKIELALSQKDKILSAYSRFRKKYSIDSIASIEKFTGCSKNVFACKKYERDITVVVPVYNTSEYIGKCLDSILNSLILNSEILIINDGSIDNSDDIIMDYVNKYPDIIRYIKQENHGLGNVRNVALKEAKGKYIASVDSDDSINECFFSAACDSIENDVDVIICDWLTVTDNGSFQTPAIDWIFKDINKYEGLLYTTIMPSTCNKIIKKSLFEQLDIKYIEDKYEDLSTNPFILMSARTIKYINNSYYEYYIRGNSIMRSSAGYSMINILREFDNRLKKYNEFLFVDEEVFKFYTYSWRIEEYIFNQLYELNEGDLKNYINYVYDNAFKLIKDIFSTKKYSNVLDSLEEKEKDYIIQRNVAFNDRKLYDFIIQARKSNDYFKLTPAIIYYGK